MQPPVQALHERLDRLNDAARTALREARPLIHVHDVGIVQSTGQGIARVSGLPGIRAEELIQFAGGVSGMVLDIEPNDVGVVLFGAQEQLSSGAEARRCRSVLDVPVGPELLGRVVNPLGTPLEMSTIPTTVPNNPRSGARVVSSPIASTPWSSSRASSRPTCFDVLVEPIWWQVGDGDGPLNQSCDMRPVGPRHRQHSCEVMRADEGADLREHPFSSATGAVELYPFCRGHGRTDDGAHEDRQQRQNHCPCFDRIRELHHDVRSPLSSEWQAPYPCRRRDALVYKWFFSLPSALESRGNSASRELIPALRQERSQGFPPCAMASWPSTGTDR